MLVGISPLIGPDLLSTLYRMGHGDEIVLADAFFPAETYGRRVVRKDGIRIPDLLNAVLPLFTLDSYMESPVTMMAPVPGDQLDPNVEAAYRAVVERHAPQAAPFARIDRFQFYERASNAFAVVITGETVKYGNVILTKGVTPITTSEKGDEPMA
ncbi:MAG TPA: L-fucose mutarotase [Candidatus Sulfomarinibacteraceae bacterium]|nr:L-fucose mutarotase [Candidatus Sulfomarinibacteraceae bacterium]